MCGGGAGFSLHRFTFGAVEIMKSSSNSSGLYIPGAACPLTFLYRKVRSCSNSMWVGRLNLYYPRVREYHLFDFEITYLTEDISILYLLREIEVFLQNIEDICVHSRLVSCPFQTGPTVPPLPRAAKMSFPPRNKAPRGKRAGSRFQGSFPLLGGLSRRGVFA
jgi:hypothetical protein